MSIYSFIVNKFNSSKLLKHYSIYTVGKVLGVISSLVLLPLFTKKIPQEEFGVVGILWLAVPILTRLINLGVDVAVTLKFFKLTHKELSNYLYNALLIILLLSLGIWLLFYFNISWVKLLLDESINKQLFTVFFFSIFSAVLLTMMNAFLQLSGKASQNVIFSLLPPIITSAVTYYLIIFIEPSYSSYIYGMATGNGIFGLVALFYFFRKYSIKHFKSSWRISKNLLKIGIPVLPGTLAGLTLAAGDRYIIKYFLGLEAVAIYIYGYRFSEYILSSIFQPFQKSIGPIIMEKAARDFKAATVYSQTMASKTVLYVSIIVALIIIPFKDVMLLLSSNSYDMSYTIFLIALFGILISNISNIYSILFNHLERMDLNMALGIICALLNVGLNIWLIPIYGIIAAAYTTVLSFIVVLILSIFLLNRFTHKKISVLKTGIGTLPILLYLIIIHIIDTGYIINRNEIFLIYGAKIVVFIAFLLLIFSVSAELRSDFQKMLLQIRKFGKE